MRNSMDRMIQRGSWLLIIRLVLLSLMVPAAKAQLQFSGPTDYPVGTAPRAVAVGDFNGDGKKDLAVVNTASGTVSILLGNSDGTFQPAVNLAGGISPTFVAVGDFNGDGKPDLAVANGSGNAVNILLGNGDGTFQPPAQYNAGVPAEYVAVADFNNDGKLDLLVSAPQRISILPGTGDGTFQAPTVTTTSGWNESVAIGDFNGDGKLDVAVGNATVYPYQTKGIVYVLPGNGDGTFQVPVISAVPFLPADLTIADFNRDGKIDLAVIANLYSVNSLHQLCTSEAVVALLGRGDATFGSYAIEYLPSARCSFPPPRNPFATNIAVADLNNDGQPDLIFPVVVPNSSIVGGQTTAIWMLLGNGDGTFQSLQKFQLDTVPGWLTVDDLNGDALPDFAVSNTSANNIGVFINTTSAIHIGSFSGTVTNASNMPIAGAMVSYSGGSTTTSTTGTYSFAAVAAGTYSVTASQTGYVSKTASVAVTSGQDSILNFQLSTAAAKGSVSGRVTNISTGAALGSVTVSYSGGSTVTSSTGTYSFASVSPGSYTFKASRTGYLSHSLSATVTAGQVTTLNFQLATSGKIAGVVKNGSGAAISGATVKVTGGKIATSVTLSTSSTGSYSTSWIPVGSYTVTVSKTGYTTQSLAATVSTGTTTTLNFTMH